METRRLLARALFAALFAMVTWLTLTPDAHDADAGFALARWIATFLFGNAGAADKVAHFLAYGALGAAIFPARLRPFRQEWSAPLTLALYGAALEGLQGLTGVRSPELADAVANGAGAVCGFGGAMALAKLLNARTV